MTSTFRICPKCGHKRELESEIPEYECPACGIIYEKYLKANALKQESSGDPEQKIIENPELKSNYSVEKVSWISQSPSKILISAIVALLLLSFAIWKVDQRTQMRHMVEAANKKIAINKEIRKTKFAIHTIDEEIYDLQFKQAAMSGLPYNEMASAYANMLEPKIQTLIREREVLTIKLEALLKKL